MLPTPEASQPQALYLAPSTPSSSGDAPYCRYGAWLPYGLGTGLGDVTRKFTERVNCDQCEKGKGRSQQTSSSPFLHPETPFPTYSLSTDISIEWTFQGTSSNLSQLIRPAEYDTSLYLPPILFPLTSFFHHSHCPRVASALHPCLRLCSPTNLGLDVILYDFCITKIVKCKEHNKCSMHSGCCINIATAKL